MNTFLSASQKALQEQYAKFLKEVLTGADLESDACNKDIMTKFGQGGYLGITVPKELGGQGGTLLDVVLFTEELSRHSAGLALCVASHYSVVECILKYATETLKSRYLPLLARGEVFGAQAFSEEMAGSDLSMVETSAILDSATNKYKLSGVKTWVANANLPALLAVVARANGNGAENPGKLGLFLLQLDGAQTVKLSARKSSMGFRSACLYIS